MKLRKSLIILLLAAMLIPAVPMTAEAGTASETIVLAAVKQGWKKISGKWYYYAHGKKVTGWKKISGKWYSFDKNGAMQAGWKKYSGKWYYLDKKNGYMVTGKKTIGGIVCNFGSTGELKQTLNKDLSTYLNKNLDVFVRLTTNLKDVGATSAKEYQNSNMIISDDFYNNKIGYIEISNKSKHTIKGISLGMTLSQADAKMKAISARRTSTTGTYRSYSLRDGSELRLYYNNGVVTDVSLFGAY